MSKDRQDDLTRRAYAPPTTSGAPLSPQAAADNRTVRVVIYGVTFVFMLIAVKVLAARGWSLVGLLVWFFIVMGAMRWYAGPRTTRPEGIPEKAGSAPCPKCGSMQTNCMYYENRLRPTCECFACEHRF